ncbi:Crp/Fnr family transcriptional regulator [Modicisalibacter xianhensis]|uniref:Transcriptional regulator, Crp/Fnr family n=1 Tax=Modicisalibacter xianhensis TaxID=442341 RepID=A0A1I3AWK8_9GAMM|nr:Crp/Fnr family transcriptional regulator [Halomonas xianhensis]SFH54414.1 transcriptional regulator, Crp/Fnr family [Halomonas xianhensis]
MSPSESCFIRQFSHFAPLSERDKHLLRTLEANPDNVVAGTTLWETGDRAGHFGVLSQGWAFSCRYMEDGTRQILDIHIPGDVIGLGEYAFHHRLNTVIMLTDGEVCYFPHRNLQEVFDESSTLTSLFFTIAGHHQALLTERLINMARRNAQQKLAHFLYETLQRMERIGLCTENRIQLPLSQQLLADLLGISTVHVSRTFAAFREQGLVFRKRQWVEIPDVHALACVAEFDGKYLDGGMSPPSEAPRQSSTV